MMPTAVGRNEHETQDQQKLLGAILDGADDLIVATDAQLRVVYVSRSLERSCGRSAALFTGKFISETGLFKGPSDALETALKRARDSGNPESLTLTWEREGASHHYAVRILIDWVGSRVHHLIARAHDISERRRIEQDLRKREYEFRTLAENWPDIIIRYGPDKRATYCNQEIRERVAVTAQSVLGRTPTEAAPAGMVGAPGYEVQLERTLATGERSTVDLVVPHPDGRVRVHSIAIAAERDSDGSISGAIAVGRDVTEQVRMQQALAAKEREFRSLAENAGDNIVRWDTQARMRYLNPAMARLYGRTIEDLLGCTPMDVSADADAQTAVVQEAILQVARDGREQMLELRFQIPGKSTSEVHQIRLVPERDDGGHIVSVLGIGRDITEKITHLEQIESLVRTDPLTRLANRQALQERMPGILAASARRDTPLGALMLLDLDQFKAVNDVLGHNAGDALLCEVAGRLTAALRANDLLVRLGGDEFVIVMDDLDTPHAVAAVSTKLHTALAAPLVVAQREMRVTASIGVAMFPQDGTNLGELLANADTAMYHAKRIGRSRTEYYRSELGEIVRRRMVLEESMRHACSGAGLELYFQPQVCLHSSGTVLGAEALLRWNHPSLGHLAPDAFIALAEETGMIVPIGRWVLREAAMTVVRWNRNRAVPLHVAVNVSTRQLIDDCLPAAVEEVLRATGCEPGWLSVEITESALAQDSARVERTLVDLRAMGIRIALDDFGTGYSALNYLTRFPVDCLKLDKSFVWGIERSNRDDEIVKAFIAMACALKLATVAEGIETEAQATFLSAHGCSVAQGYLFGRPMPAERFERDCLSGGSQVGRINGEA